MCFFFFPIIYWTKVCTEANLTVETNTAGSVPHHPSPYPGPPGWEEEGGDLRAEDGEGTQLQEEEEPGRRVWIDIFFKKKIITIYLHLGYLCFCLKTPYVVCIAGSLTRNHGQQHCNSDWSMANTHFLGKAHHSLPELSTARENFSTLGGHF